MIHMAQILLGLRGMRFIPTKAHAILDYLMGVLMIALPWLLDFAAGGAETWTFVILGLGVIFYSLFTDYEYSISRSIPMQTHLVLDMAAGAILALSPWIFNFDEFVYWPHVIVGVAEILAGLMTHRVPSTTRQERPATTTRPIEGHH